jgi:hypothetical protein
MRPIDTSDGMRIAPRDAARDDDAAQANQFGDSLRAAVRRAGAPAPVPAPTPSMPRDAAARDRDAEAAREAPSTATDTAPASAPRADTARAAQANPAPGMPPATHTPPGTTGARAASSRNGEASPAPEAPRAPAPPAQATQQHPIAALDARDARPRAHATGHDRAAQRSAHRHADTPQPPEGIALQTLLAAAHPLLAGAGDGDGAAASAPAPSALTPQDVAASVTQAWLREPSTHDVSGVDGSARWTFTLGDPLTPLAALHISGDPTAGWGLQLTAGNGLPARELAAHTERLRRRLRARGQAVDRLEVDDDPHR